MPGSAALSGALIREARSRAGFTQRQLAHRLGTSQSLVARWEKGHVEPTLGTLLRAIRACGLELTVDLATYDEDHDRLIEDNLRLTPEQRLKKMLDSSEGIDRLVKSIRQTHV